MFFLLGSLIKACENDKIRCSKATPKTKMKPYE